MHALAVGKMGMSLDTYLQLTPGQTVEAYLQWKQEKQEDFERDDLSRWRIARWQTWTQLYPPDKKTASQFDILDLPGDDKIKEYLKKKREAKKRKQPARDERRFRAIVERWKE